jgi:nitrogen fixation protein FixH
MKLNWGTGIAIVYVTFALSMVGLVIASRHHNPGLTENDYYNLDIHYQEHLDKKINTAALAVQPQVVYDSPQKAVEIQFPEGMGVNGGTARFYRAETTGDDFTTKLESLSNGKIGVPAGAMHSGKWHVELDWEAGGKKYFYETTFNVKNA